MTEAEWLACDEPSPLWESCASWANDRKLRLFGCACCRLVQSKLIDARCITLITQAEAFADARTNEERALIHEYRRSANKLLTEYAGSHSVQAIRSLLLPSATNAAAAAASYAVSIGSNGYEPRKPSERAAQVLLLRDIFGNPFRPVSFDPAWRTDTAVSLARQMYDSRKFGAMPILADALQDAGCENEDVLGHLRGDGPHVRGCWVVDLVLDKE
jgi:hypothetical protein